MTNSGLKILAFSWFLFCCSVKLGNCQQIEKPASSENIKVLSFNILYGGSQAKSVGFANKDFGGSRIDEIAEVILESKSQIVCIQEDCSGDQILKQLQKKNPAWNRFDHVYSTWKISPISKTERAFGTTVCNVTHPNGTKIAVINTHWYPSPFGPDLLQKELRKGKPANLQTLGNQIAKRSEKFKGYRGYDQTIKAIKQVPKGQPILVAGDFNEPSHLDWTDRFHKNGIDRWRKNPTETKLSIPISWTGSKLVHNTGLKDAYRSVHSDVVSKPGITFTPDYPPGSPGRKPIGDQTHTRIDRIYFSPNTLRPISSKVVGEKSPWTDVVYSRRWPSDHRAVSATFKLTSKKSDLKTSYNRNSLTFLNDQVYGHKYGMALTYDVIKPKKPNGAGIMFMVSGGWVSRWYPPAAAFRRKPRTLNLFEKMVSKGYTVFLVRHGSSPKFKVPEAVSDSKKAFQHIQKNAKKYGISTNQIGVCGGSAGGHLSLMLGTTGRAGRRVAAIVSYFPPTDLTGIVDDPELKKQFPALDFPNQMAESVSPLFKAEKSFPPTLMIHGDKDRLVPLWHSKRMEKKLEELEVPNRLVVIPGAAHGFQGKDKQLAESELLKWFDQYLLNKK